MEFNFEQELPNANEWISSEQISEFYEKMKSIVVLIESFGLFEHDPYSAGDAEFQSDCSQPNAIPGHAVTGAGVLIDKGGLVLTCARIIPQTTEPNDIVIRLVGDDGFDVAERVAICPKMDLALLRIKGRGDDFNFGRIANEEAGSLMLTIGHPNKLVYSFLVGANAKPMGYRMLKEVVWKGYDRGFDGYQQDLKLFQIGGFAGGEGMSGSPIYDSRGRIIGVYIIEMRSFSYAVHWSEIRKFINDKRPSFFKNEPIEGQKGKGKPMIK